MTRLMKAVGLIRVPCKVEDERLERVEQETRRRLEELRALQAEIRLDHLRDRRGS